MDDFWNSKSLKPPPVNSFKCKSPAIDLKNVISILEKAIDTFIIPNALRVESNVMRRVIYRLKLQFRLDKGFKLFENTNRNLNRLFAFNITKDLMYLLDEVPKKYNKDFSFPSKQMLEYLLVRLQGYSQVCSRVVESAFNTAILMKGRVRLGHQWEIAAVIIAICSRILQICRHLTTECCVVYNELLPLLDKLEITGSKWLPDNYQFPKDLTEWLNYDWLFEKPDVILQLPLELPVFSLLDDDEYDVQYNGRYKLNKSKTIIIADDSEDEEDDIGNVKFVCSFNKSYVKLNHQQVKKLEPKVLTINDSDSESGTTLRKNGIPTIRSFDNLSISDDSSEEDDVQIIESTASLNISGVAALETENEVTNINVINEDKDDAGEIISREEFMKNNLTDQNKSNDLEPKSNDVEPKSNDLEPKSNNLESKCNYLEPKSNDVEPKSNDLESKSNDLEPTSDDESDSSILSLLSTYQLAKSKNKDGECSGNDGEVSEEISTTLPMEIKLKDNNLKMVSVQDIEGFLNKETTLRPYLKNVSNGEPKTKSQRKVQRKCLSSHLDDDIWSYLYYELKHYISMAKNAYEDHDECIRRAQNLMKKVINDTDEKEDDFSEFTREEFRRMPTPLAFENRAFIINCLETVQDLQLFLQREEEFRPKTPNKSFFGHIDIDVWVAAVYEIKTLILLAYQKPLQQFKNIQKVKSKFLTFLKNYELDSSSEEYEDVIENKKDIDKLYNCIALGKRLDDDCLFEYVQGLNDYIVPRMSSTMRRKIKKPSIEPSIKNKNKIRKITAWFGTEKPKPEKPPKPKAPVNTKPKMNKKPPLHPKVPPNLESLEEPECLTPKQRRKLLKRKLVLQKKEEYKKFKMEKENK